ncbi:16S rRNA (cytosine(1402)-N(4))-methyltransferase RsmH [Qipengyuania flava]|uniref:16S rRNA (cytosine(1402)-N(4))-methyltransferase RsmH n=1 Tax=Qipengyuania flava TaxID=192812 RepID=UPI001C59DFF3|nr:16S rRNA (cytosine(1402)-N(4))-methyltransferase RsmH [Qipengyuania flava]MBW3167643.1 16S rRNA (cytosine(1402)-N(4))-methyltransferase RsmH [Qipengyuania flava]MBY5964881.1 16S rRNA (cytosine(1402)-N(4))-methyltransferase RsmH [Qipengyuania flava]MBY6011205.1 16S rRNA (cytosine(1402)-N(4))-methyltransferase RsmH [Qipengyuania flava]MBY6025647.1 16S rRNA (cytosine(1402)-N(4))-methyltransferase RsmH [Qipengyuania flava]UOR09843.1 16S rRNA (cytosine(1402)-N(4))-methyltransferase RsmH [Qipengy
MSAAPHVPVLLEEVIAALDPQPGDVVIDATFGAGGYTRALLDRGATVHAFDRDPDAIAAGQRWAETQESPPRLVLHPHRFSEMLDVMTSVGLARVDGVVMDIGVSSMQLDQAHRGFAFSADGPLDMRMSQDGASAADFLNTADEKAIADVLYTYGEERQSRRVARAIVAARPLETTGELARIVRKALGHKPHDKKDPATRTFQAVRIHVNGELDELSAGLSAAESLLREGGRLAVVSFHSLEDRIVKRFLREASSTPSASRHVPLAAQDDPVFSQVSKAIKPGEAELERNPRARSSVLRHATRTATPAREAA